MFGLAIWSGMNDAEAEEVVMKEAETYLENESYYRPKNIFLRYGQVGYYASESKSTVIKWAAFAADLFNPIDDGVAITDLIADAIKAGSEKLNEMEEEANEVIRKNGRLPPEENGPSAWLKRWFTLGDLLDESYGGGYDGPP
jgi:hypothetical protein